MRYVLIVAAMLLVAACETPTTQRYSISADNNLALKSTGATGVVLGDFSSSVSFDASCRMLGPMQVADGLTHTQYIRKAFEEEFKIAGIYATGAPRVRLAGKVTRLEFSSTSGLTGGYWNIDLTIQSSNGRSMKVAESYQFSSGFQANDACRNTAEAFSRAVQNIVGKAVRNSSFAALVS